MGIKTQYTRGCVQLFILPARSLEKILSAHQSSAACLLSLRLKKSPLPFFLEVAQRFDPSYTVWFCS